jgi:tetratricopeptide (TPR) repeat protein
MEILKKMLTWTLYLTPVVLLFNGDGLFFPFISGKNFLFRALVDLSLVLFIAVFLYEGRLQFKKTWLNFAVLGFLISVLIADTFALNPFKAFFSNFERSEGFVSIFHLSAYFFILTTFFKQEEKKWIGFFSALITTSFASILFSLVQLGGGAVINQGGTRTDSVFGNSAYFAGFLLLSFFVALLLWSKKNFSLKHEATIFFTGSFLYLLVFLKYLSPIPKEMQKTGFGWLIFLIAFSYSLFLFFIKDSRNENLKKILRSFSLVAFCFLCVFLVYKTQTRGAILGIFGGILSGSIFLLFCKNALKSHKKIAIAIIALLAISIGSFFAFKDSQFVQQSPTLKRLSEISWKERSTQARSIIWPMALEGVKERPIFGWGQEGFMYVFAKQYRPEMWRHEAWFDRTHNVYLDWLIAGGLVTFVFYLSFYILSILSSFKISKENPEEGAIIFALILAYGFQNIFIFDNLASYIVFFALLAYLSPVVSFSKKENLETPKKEKKKEEDPHALFFVGLILVLFVFYYSVLKPYSQNTGLIKAMQVVGTGNAPAALESFKEVTSISSSGQLEALDQYLSFASNALRSGQLPDDFKQNLLVDVDTRYRQQIQKQPYDARALLALGSFYNEFGFVDSALPLLLEAEKLSPKKQSILFQIGLVYVTAKDKEEALVYFKKAYELAPEYTQSGMLYSFAMLKFGEIGSAQELLLSYAKKGEKPESFVVKELVESNNQNIAISLLRTAIGVNPKNYEPREELFRVYVAIKQPLEARKVAEEMGQVSGLEDRAQKLLQNL